MALSDGYKVVALYLLTGPQTNRMGCYVLSPGEAAEDLNKSLPAFLKALSVCCEAFGWRFDREARVFWIPTWFEWNEIENPSQLKGALSDLTEVPDCAVRRSCVESVVAAFPAFCREAGVEDCGGHSGDHSVGDSGAHGARHQEQEKEKEQEQEQEREPEPPRALPPPDRRRPESRAWPRISVGPNPRIVHYGRVEVWDWMHQKLAARLGEADDAWLTLMAFYDEVEARWQSEKAVPPGKPMDIWQAEFDRKFSTPKGQGADLSTEAIVAAMEARRKA